MNLNNNLPDSWELTTIDQVGHIEMGQSPESRYYNAEGVGLPFFQGKAEFGARYPEVRKWCSEPTKIAEAGDILLSIRAPVGPTNIAKDRSCIGRGLAAIRAEQGVNSLYLFYFLRHIESWLSEQGTGSTFAAISGHFVKQLKCAIAPSNEQNRIIEKLEELFSDLDAGVSELKTAQKKLTHYCQSLLKAAVEGELTAEWRTKNQPNETGAQLLERILKERRSRWEEKQLAKFKEQGKTPPNGWRDKYPEPVQPDTANHLALPEGWVWASVDTLLSEIETGKSFKCDERPPTVDEVGVVKVSAVTWGEYNEQESKTCTDPDRINEALFVSPGDFLFSRANTIELVGACVIAEKVTLDVMLSDKILRFVLVDDNTKKWLLFFLRSDFGRTQIESLASGNQESMRNIGQERIRQILTVL